MNEWETDRWFVSPWDYSEDVKRNWHFVPHPKIHDVTLRDGEQQAGIVFTKDDKVCIAEKLAEIGVHRIEAGMPASSEEDAQAITEIVRRGLGPEIFAFSRCMIEDVKRAVDCGVSGVVIEIPASSHIVEKAYRWPLQRALDLSVESTRFAHENGLYVVFFPIDGTRADIDWLLELLQTVANYGHMDAFGLVDTFGVLSPSAVAGVTRYIKSKVNKPLEVHFHNDFGFGAANTVLAMAAGADVAHTTVAGIGERAGNAPYEEVALALKTMYGIDLGLRLEKAVELAKLVTQIAGLQDRPNRPVIGDATFRIESGIIASWFRNAFEIDPLELVPYHWTMVGQDPPSVVLGKKSGKDSIFLALSALGEDPDQFDIDGLLRAVKSAGLKFRRVISEAEFRELAEEYRLSR